MIRPLDIILVGMVDWSKSVKKLKLKHETTFFPSYTNKTFVHIIKD